MPLTRCWPTSSALCAAAKPTVPRKPTSLRRTFEAPAAPALILVDAGPLGGSHRCRRSAPREVCRDLQTIREPLPPSGRR